MPESTPERPEDAITLIHDWLTSFVAKPNSELGRTGAVCPFVGPAIDKKLLQCISTDIQPDINSLRTLLTESKEKFIDDASQADFEELIYASRVIVLSNFCNQNDADMMDEVQASLKVEFMEAGLMLGQFHPYRETPGLHNEKFSPHKCPGFCFAIRHMIAWDHVFVKQDLPPERIESAVGAFLRRYQSVIPKDILDNLRT